MVLNGTEIAGEILAELKKKPKPAGFFAGIVAESDPAALSFQKLKQRTAKELGIDYRIFEFADSLTSDELREEVGRIANQKSCGAVVVQLPLPEKVNRQYVLNAIPREKDPDVLGERALGAFYAGRNPVLPPAAATVAEILTRMDWELKNKRIAVVGAGFLVGRPVAVSLQGLAKEIFILDIGSDLSALKDADLVISGTGKPGLFGADHLKDGAAVIDFGYAEKDGKLAGDFDPAGADKKLSFYTPTPGGTGPILIAKLFENFYRLGGLFKSDQAK